MGVITKTYAVYKYKDKSDLSDQISPIGQSLFLVVICIFNWNKDRDVQ